MMEQILIGLLIGAGFGLFGYATKAWDPDEGYESLNPRKLARTIVLFAAAGALVSMQGGRVEFALVQQTVEQSAYIGVLGTVFDNLWARFVRHRLATLLDGW